MIGEIVAQVREAYGWSTEVGVSAGPRGALGQIWRLDVGAVRYALKQIFFEPPSEELLAAELAFTRRAAAAGVRLPASYADRHGRRLLTAGDGTWLRLYEWVDLRPVDLSSPDTPGELGELLARLHRCAGTAAVEADGEPPARWYDQIPTRHEWAAAAASGAGWAPLLAERVATLPELCAAVAPVDPAGSIVCHRDLHPENVLAGADGELVVVDWDNIGPAAPARELAGALFDWFCDGPSADLDAMRELYAAYVHHGGPGRITGPADFSMLLACRLNFLVMQANVAIDADADQRDREWAEREVEEGLRILPTARQLAEVLRVVRPVGEVPGVVGSS